MTLEQLTTVSPPFVTINVAVQDVAAKALGWQEANLTVRAVRGRKARTTQGLFDEFAAALQFPYYFGENWNAFSDCISDLDWLPQRSGVVVLVYSADQVLAHANAGELETLVRLVTGAAAGLGESVDAGESWDRPAVPFHLVLHGQPSDGFERWHQAGAALEPLR